MNLMKTLTKIFFLLTVIIYFTGCSYITNEIDEELNERSSFTGKGVYNQSTHTVTISWDETWSSVDHFEIYRTAEPNDEFSDYEYIGSCSSDEESYNDIIPASLIRGIYFYRIAKIKKSDDDDDGEEEPYIDEVSGYIMVKIE